MSATLEEITRQAVTLAGRTKRLTTRQVAQLADVTPQTINTYVSRGTIPQPDGYGRDGAWWKIDTIALWLAFRRGVGRPPKTDIGT